MTKLPNFAALRNKQEPSFCQNALAAAQKNEITYDNACRLVAHRIADTLSEHTPVLFPPMPPMVRDYVDRRFKNMIPREPSLAVMNGNWLVLTSNAIDQNMREIDLLQWAHKLCLETKAEEKAARIKEHYVKFEESEYQFPREEYKAARQVQHMDSIEKQRGGAQ